MHACHVRVRGMSLEPKGIIVMLEPQITAEIETAFLYFEIFGTQFEN